MEDNVNLYISEEVIYAMTEKVVKSIPGVYSLSGGIKGGINNMLGKKLLSQGIKVDITDKTILLDVYIIVNYGVKIPDIAWEIQEKVKKELENMTGMIVKIINVHIQGINYPNNDKKDS